ncbi:MAG: type II toxin-antitoxin system RelE/ParE family toxin [Vicingaceae bacterium]|nr:type II toxin-antitoxin system RelE/ParE family toxin [Vicingaceae bacterium]
MEIEFTKRFKKEFHSLSKNNNLAKQLNNVIDNVAKANNITEIKNIKKLVGYTEYFRIRVGNYRIGVKILKKVVVFSVFDHRKDIYKRFP